MKLKPLFSSVCQGEITGLHDLVPHGLVPCPKHVALFLIYTRSTVLCCNPNLLLHLKRQLALYQAVISPNMVLPIICFIIKDAFYKTKLEKIQPLLCLSALSHI